MDEELKMEERWKEYDWRASMGGGSMTEGGGAFREKQVISWLVMINYYLVSLLLITTINNIMQLA